MYGNQTSYVHHNSMMHTKLQVNYWSQIKHLETVDEEPLRGNATENSHLLLFIFIL